MLHGFCEALQGRLSAWMRDVSFSQQSTQEVLLDFLKSWAEKQCMANEHAHYQLSTALAGLQEHGLGSLGAPYGASVRAISPQGFPVTLTVAKHDAGALMETLGQMLPWLRSQQYQVPQEYGT